MDWPGIETGDPKWETGDRQADSLTYDMAWHYTARQITTGGSSVTYCFFWIYYKAISWHSNLQGPQISNFKVYNGNQQIRKENSEESVGGDECTEQDNEPRH